MKSNSPLRRAVYAFLSVLLILALWEIAARTLDMGFVFPSVGATLRAWASLIRSSRFLLSVAGSLLHISYGLLIGTALGVLLAVATESSGFVRTFVSLVMTVVRSTPVASVILVLWCVIAPSAVPTVIAVLMVAPIVWQNLSDGFASVDRGLTEVAQVYGFSFLRRWKVLYLPSFLRFLIPSVITAAGLGWKAGIAAEIIAYASFRLGGKTVSSIGKNILDAKNAFEGAEVFAWTLTVILLSLAIEVLLKKIGKEVMKRWHLN